MPDTSHSRTGFRALLITQFLGAFNDNLFKTTLSLLVVASTMDEGAQGRLLSIASSMLVVPYLLFSSYAGYVADRFRKSTVIKAVKAMEVVIILFALIFLIQGKIYWLFFVLFMMGLQSALFSPSKYGAVPELLPDEELSKGNGYLNSTTFLAILFGTAFGGTLLAYGRTFPGYVMFAIALLGLGAGLLVPATPLPSFTRKFDLNPWSEVWATWKEIRLNRPIFLTIIASAYFWFLGAVLHLNVFLYANQLLHVEKIATSGLLAALAIGIGIGSLVAGLVSEGNVELGLVPLGSAGMFACLLCMAALPPGYYIFGLLLLILGVFSGLYMVPLEAYLQHASPVDKRGSYIAAANFVTFVGVLGASLVLWITSDVLRMSPRSICGLLTVLTLGASVYIVRLMPDMLLRCVNWILTHTLYRIEILGRENFPSSGGALLVSNHLSFVDALLILASAKRPVRFLMYGPIMKVPLVGFLAKIARVIPIDGKLGREHVLEALKSARESVEGGDLVCIFPEGSISRLGVLLPFKTGMEDIMRDLKSPVIPVHLDQLWGSIFSFKLGKLLSALPKRIPYPVTVSFGQPLPSSVSAFDARQAVAELSVDAVSKRTKIGRSLTETFLRETRRAPNEVALIDLDGSQHSRLELLCLAEDLAIKWQRADIAGRFVGVALCPGSSCLAAMLALLLIGKVPVYLDPALSNEELDHRLSTAGAQTLIGVPRDLGNKVTILEPGKCQRREGIGSFKEWIASYGPSRVRTWKRGSLGADEAAAVVFTAGRRGEPKAVVYSHEGILNNLTTLSDLFNLKSGDRLSGLPLVNSFSLILSLWLPALCRSPVIARRNLTDGGIAEIESAAVTALLCTTSELVEFLTSPNNTLPKCIERIFVGGDTFEENTFLEAESRFKVPIYQAYGLAEVGGIAIVSLPDFEAGKHTQFGKKTGMAGVALPGVATKIVDSVSGSKCTQGSRGELWIKSSSGAVGYLKKGELLTLSSDGWVSSGDLAEMDEAGFIRIFEGPQLN